MATIDELNQFGQTWANAELHGDVDTLNNLLAGDFSGVGPLGFLLNKEQWLARFRSGDLTYESFTWDDASPRLYGDAAVVVGRQTQSGSHQGHSIQAQFRVTQTLVKQDGTWRLAALQLSPLTPLPGR
jgi:ketosteroid isomerase-like protein